MMQTSAVTWLPLAGTGLIGGVVGWLLARQRGGSDVLPRGVDPYLLPDPAIRWLLRSHGALGIWVSEPAASGGPPNGWQRVIAEGRLKLEQMETIESRLSEACGRGSSGAERLDGGTLLFGSTGGYGAGILLPEDTPSGQVANAADDLLSLLDGLARRPIVRRISSEFEQPVESASSVGLRLAYQLERLLDAEVLVALKDKNGVRVVGVSGRADRRLIDTYAGDGSPMHQVAMGMVPSLTSIADPLGGAVPDRRSRFAPAIVLPVRCGDETIGAVAFWTSDESEPVGPVIAEVQSIMRHAGPRFQRALTTEGYREESEVDPLTGLKNRRGLDKALGRLGVQQGVLVYVDLDRFKLLNDTLGHPAGDAALVHVARQLTRGVRDSDTVARMGGEEFALWLPGGPLSVGFRLAEDIRLKLVATPWEWQGKPWKLSASFGVAACPETSRSLANLAAQADAALVEAKQGGRNRTVVAPLREES